MASLLRIAAYRDANRKENTVLFVVIIFLLVGGVGWCATQIRKERMEKRLGRKVRGKHELTSLTSWMEAEMKDKK